MNNKLACFIVVSIAFFFVAIEIKAQSIATKAYVINPTGDTSISNQKIREVRELKATNTEVEIYSFIFYTTDGYRSMFARNQGAIFNQIILDEIKTMKIGQQVVFDEISVKNKQGVLSTLKSFIIKID